VVREVLAHRPELVTELYLTPEAFERHEGLADAAQEAGIVFELASEAALAAMADTQTPQGVVAVARQSPVRLRDALNRDSRLVVVLDEVRDPGNAGTIIRAADAAGADAVILTGTSVDPYNPKVVRATTGSLFHLTVATGAPLEAAIEQAHDAGLTVLAADMAGEPLPSLGDALAAPTTWVFGNEAHGLSDAARSLADRLVAVPIYGAAESLNLATAASVCLYASAFAQRA
jgi:TrmH family RNA methyltransferase